MQAQIIFPKTERPKPAKKDPVYEAFKRRALQLIDKGRRRYGAKRIVEEIRYDTTLQHAPEYADGYKVNNNMTSLYARRFMEEHPEHDGFFKTRRSQYDDLI